MKIFTVILFLFLSGSASALETYDFNVRGYDDQGNKVRCEGLREQETCGVKKSDFTERCLTQGHQLLFCSDCTVLCSQPLEN